MKKVTIVLVLMALLAATSSVAYRIPTVRDFVAQLLPLDLKIKIKRTLFTASALRDDLALKNLELEQLAIARDQETTRLAKIIAEERDKSERLSRQRLFADVSTGPQAAWPELAHVYSQSQHNLSLHRSPDRTITATNGRQYRLRQFPLPFLPTYFEFGFKPLFFLDFTAEYLYLITGDGVIFKTKRQELDNGRIELSTVPSNLRTVIDDSAIYEPGWFSIKDLKILGDTIYISYNKKVDDKYTLALLSAKLDQAPLVFEEFFSLDDPVSTAEPFNAHQVGGRIAAFKDNQLLISTGEYRKYEKPQDDNSLFGKIFAINVDTKQTQLISKGHRNPQGLDFDPASGMVISTEHGPMGGDEINLNLLQAGSISADIPNFGWPISSYGKHYDSRPHEDAPLHKSHMDHGFIEPIKYFDPSVGISQVVKIPADFAAGFSNDYFVATMGLNSKVAIHSLLHFRLDQASEKIIQEDSIKIGERIRDMVVLNKTQLGLALEGNGIPAIGLLEAVKK